MKLADYISEAISHGRHTKRYDFPDDHTDKDGIINWLEGNGYDLVVADNIRIDANNTLARYKKQTGRNCYCIGDFKDKVTHWIRILKDDKIYFIRTNDYYNGIIDKSPFLTFDIDNKLLMSYIDYHQIIDAMNG